TAALRLAAAARLGGRSGRSADRRDVCLARRVELRPAAPGVARRARDRAPLSRARDRRSPMNDWFKDAVIYEAHVRAFFDSNNDGIGDFAGLTGKLDYLQGLGINALWLL